MPSVYKRKTDRKGYKTKLPQTVPKKFKAGFLSTLDQRTGVAQALKRNYDQIVSDIGGPSEVSYLKGVLIERTVWLTAIVQTMEVEMANGDVDRGEVLGRWIQALNSLVGLSKTLGIERQARAIKFDFADPSPTVIDAPTELEDK